MTSKSIARGHENDQAVIDTDVHIALPEGKCEVFVSKSGSILRDHENDLISRQRAIYAIEKRMDDITCEEFAEGMSEAITEISLLPSAQPKQNDCESCRYNAYEWDEEPCDSCTGVGNHWKPSTQPMNVQEAHYRGMLDGVKGCTEKLKSAIEVVANGRDKE